MNLFQPTVSLALRRVMYAAAFVSGVSVWSQPALAATQGDHPRLAPMKDVTVVYHLAPQMMPKAGDAQQKNKDVKVAFSGSGDWVRIDSADGRGVTILDRPHGVVTLIMLEQHLYTQLHPQHGLHNPFLLDLSMNYTRSGHDIIAGVPCVKWSISNTHGKAEACVTEDGVILSENGVDADGAEGAIKAVSVSYHDLPSSIFAPPDGFHPLTIKPHPVGAPVSGGAAVPSANTPAVPSGAPEGGEPPVSDDSATDGTVSQPDQPPSTSAKAPTEGPVPGVGGGQ
ncbi:hypothetical protein AA106555_1204 [Neokomagataea thailandica NBRC 106555]|uniref:DUF4412 domain-containing protein n=2 Tax=Neokomagataea TaxID=1223423 RepID=A0A4Y6V644_9PROT|nr:MULTISPECIES: hypothetical protein [Neokomagataea]QDH24338.1 hypothetical protein D5366_02640 [Neokomagataea tanensis]GBR53196.1 hypothetical protein AA106555_1204 [Neokomagataea thailandica NBRC 106555]